MTTSSQVTPSVPLWISDLMAIAVPTTVAVPLWVADLPSAAWYPDPLNDARVRYWSGFWWTETTMPTVAPRHDTVDADVAERRDAKRAPVRAALFSAFGRESDEAGGDPPLSDAGSFCPPIPLDQ